MDDSEALSKTKARANEMTHCVKMFAVEAGNELVHCYLRDLNGEELKENSNSFLKVILLACLSI